MYWIIEKIRETEDFAEYKYSFESSSLTGKFTIDKHKLTCNIQNYAEKSTNFDVGKLIIKLINDFKETGIWAARKMFCTG